MTRQEEIGWLAHQCNAADSYSAEAESAIEDGFAHDAYYNARLAACAGKIALDHLAALEQQAITAYLAEVPLPEGWTEEAGDVYRYWQVIDGIDAPVERVFATKKLVNVCALPAHWPAIPLPVLLRAAVQCHRLREAGRS